MFNFSKGSWDKFWLYRIDWKNPQKHALGKALLSHVNPKGFSLLLWATGFAGWSFWHHLSSLSPGIPAMGWIFVTGMVLMGANAAWEMFQIARMVIGILSGPFAIIVYAFDLFWGTDNPYYVVIPTAALLFVISVVLARMFYNMVLVFDKHKDDLK